MSDEYKEVHDERIRHRIHARYKDQIPQLQALGFTEEFDMREKLFPLSALLFLPMLPYSIFYLGDVLGFGGFFQVMAYEPYFLHEDAYSYGIVEGRGVIFTTMFADGTIVRTRSFESLISEMVKGKPEHKLKLQVCKSGDIDETWSLHRTRISQLADNGHEPISIHTSKDMMLIQGRINEIGSGKEPTLWPGSHRKKSDG